MNLRVCHMISGDLWAGAEAMAFHLLQGLHRRPGIEVMAIVLNRGELSNALESAGVPTCVIDESGRSFPGIARTAARFVADRSPHVLHSHRYKENALAYVVSRALRQHVALVATQHGLPEPYTGWKKLILRLRSTANFRLLASRFAVTVAVSADIQKALVRDHGFECDDVEVIQNGVVTCFAPRRAIKAGTFKFGSAGRIVEVKDFGLMVNVAQLVCKQGDEIQFEIAGDGPMRAELERQIRLCGLSRQFSLLGFVKDIDTFYGGLDVYLNTSIHEGTPMSVLEAMARAIPVVVGGVGGLEEIVTDGVDGFVVRDRSAEQFATRCRELYESAELRERMSRASQKTATERFSVERMVSSYVALYRRVAMVA
jgi:glycosyltransferase involved in cell wall biosynthesis